MILRTSIAILMFCEAGMLGLLGDSFALPILFMVVTLFLYIRPIQVEIPLSIRILVPTILIGYFFFRYVSVPKLMSRTEWIFPIRITVSLAECFLFGQIFELIRKKRESADGLLNYCLLAMAVVVCSCCRIATGSERALLFTGAVVSITLICTIFQYSTRAFSGESQSGKHHYLSRSTLVVLTMLLVGLSSWYLSGFLRYNIEDFQSWWSKNFRAAGLGVSDSSIGFTDGATLNNITDLKKSDPLTPVLHVYCDAPPGYLRGRAYDTFFGLHWQRIRSTQTIFSTDPPTSLVDNGDKFFRLEQGELENHRQIRIQHQTPMGFFFLPLNAHFVSGQPAGGSNSIQADLSRIVIGGLTTNVSYSGYVSREPPRIELNPGYRDLLTGIPQSVEPGITELARSITSGLSTDQQKIDAIESYFNDNYQYSLNQDPFPDDRDRLSYFILEKPPAHCEFFASAAVVFLRANGIPARYVTGFATVESAGSDDYYIARNKDAHAWAEAWNRDTRQWVIVEATPGSEFPRSIWDQLDSAADTDEIESEIDANRNSRFRWSNLIQQIWIQIRSFFEELGNRARGPLNMALIALLVFGFFYRYWWKRRKQLATLGQKGLLKKELLRAEKILRRMRFSRESNESIRQFEKRVRQQADPELLHRIEPVLDWLTIYQEMRFGPEVPDARIPPVPTI